MGNEVKIVITTDASGAVTGLKAVESSADGLASKTAASTETLGSKLKAHWVSISIAGVAAYAAIQKAGELMKQGAEGIMIESAYKNVANAYGQNADAMLAKLKQLSQGTIEETDIMKRAIRGLQQGFSDQDIFALMEISLKQASAAGLEVGATFDMITNAVANQTTRGLKNVGIIIDQTKAYEQYAKTLDIGVNALTEMQQSQALLNAVKEEGARQTEALGKVEDEAFKAIQQKAAQIKEIQEGLGRVLLWIKDAFMAFLYAFGAGVNGLVVLLLKPLSVLEKAWGGTMFTNAMDNAKAAMTEWSDKGGKIWEGLTADTDKATAAVTAHQEKLKGLAKIKADELTATTNRERTEKAMKKWTAEISGMDPDLSEFAKQIDALKAKKVEMIKDLGESKADALYGQGYANIMKAQTKAFTDVMLEGLYGIQKETAELNKWYDENLKKFGDNEQRKTELAELYAKKRMEMTAKYAKEGAQQAIDNLTKWKDYWTQVYDAATAKAKEHYDKAAEWAKAEKQGLDYLADKKMSRLNPDQQFNQGYDTLRKQTGAAISSRDPQQIIEAMTKAQAFMDKWEKEPQSQSMFGASKMKDIEADYLKMTELSGKQKTSQQQSGDAWQKWANDVKAYIQQVEERIDALKQKIEGIDAILNKAHTLQIDTSQATKDLEALGIKMSDLLAKAGQFGGANQRGGGTVAWADTSTGYVAPDGYDPITGNYTGATSSPVAAPSSPVPPAAQSASVGGASGNTFNLGGITIQGNNPTEIARQVVKPIRDELRRLQHIS